MEQITKAAGHGEKNGAPSLKDLELINRFAKRTLLESDVYTFRLLLLDNEIDRDNERFTEETILGLKDLFLGKAGLFDHNWSAKDQTARIYKTEVEYSKEHLTAAGDRYCCLKAHAYMLRKGNEALIDEIEAGIKREVSVGCSVSKVICSVCKSELKDCIHSKGTTYQAGGKSKLCFGELTGPKDAYEWSFVAVPAQKNAGVLKSFVTKGDENMTLENHIEKWKQSGEAALLDEIETLRKQARFGREKLESLKKDTLRIMCLLGLPAENGQLDALLQGLPGEELPALHKAFLKLAENQYPDSAQIVPERDSSRSQDDEYRI